MKLSVVIPVYNEADTVAAILDKILALDHGDGQAVEILLVDDGSSDPSGEIIAEYLQSHPQADIRAYFHEKNRGKGAALQTGIKEATGDLVIIQDADLEYDPDEYSLLMQPILDGHADVVYGSRYLGGNPHRILFFWHSIGNRLLTLFSNFMTNLNLTDVETCYKLFRREILQGLNLKEKRFGFEPEVTAKMSRVPGIRIYEVGISYYGRTYAEGKKVNWKDGFRTIYCILKYNTWSRK
ncbi:MAG: glycosyltransferase family 2 protein [Candidatus Marinimicrobia bacterium]|nr:glycosyltransferase family 2 protein [Candidatus Neomarinimicrobiota bacterium]